MKEKLDHTLTPEELLRYNRQVMLPEIGQGGQQKLKTARVLVIGIGGLGSPVSVYLTAAGIGTLGIVDFDVVELTNLQRQTVYSTSDVGQPKLLAAKKRLSQINPTVKIETYDVRLNTKNAERIIREYDIIIDGTDNFPARYLMNETCVRLNKPFIYGSVCQFEGQISVFDARKGPCYQCLFEEPPPESIMPPSAENGVLGAVPGIIGMIQSAEAIKLILGKGTPLIGRMLILDALDMQFREMTLTKNPKCPVCGTPHNPDAS